jgi:hypothetical protein
MAAHDSSQDIPLILRQYRPELPPSHPAWFQAQARSQAA